MVVDDDTNIDGWGKLDLVVVGMKMIWPETPWWEDDAVRINDARADCGDAFIFCGRREEGGGRRREEGGGREGERARGVRETFFLAPFLWLSTVFLFFGVEMQVRVRVRHGDLRLLNNSTR